MFMRLNPIVSKIICFLFFVFFIFSTQLFSAEVTCSVKDSCSQRNTLFYLPNYYFTGLDSFFSAHVSSFNNLNYQKSLCCESETFNNAGDELEFSYQIPTSSGECPANTGEGIFYFSYYGLDPINAFISAKENFDSFKHKRVLCVKKPSKQSSVDIRFERTDDNNLINLGYVCAARVNEKENGVISDCNFRKPDGSPYDFTIWIKAFETTSSIRCNLDCTSKLDGRVYKACASSVLACSDVPDECDGSIQGAWVSRGDGTQILCKFPWDKTRTDPSFNKDNSEKEEIEIDSRSNCKDLISKDYNVLYENKPTRMRIYVCMD